jgi:hypothetical protein
MRMTNTGRSAAARALLPRQIGPRIKAVNEHFGHIAQAAIDTLATAAVNKSRNAIAVDSFPCNIHRYQMGSIPCTCKGRIAQLPDEFIYPAHDTQMRTEDGGTPEYLSPNSVKLKAKIYSRPDGVSDQHKLFKGDLPLNQDLNNSTIETNMDTQVGDMPELDFDNLPILGTFPALDEKQCGICAGTGFIDSYIWTSGHRYILRPEHANLGAYAEINTNTRPHTIDIRGNNSVTWTIKIPAYFEYLDVWRVRDNVEIAPELALTVDITGTGDGPWLPLSVGVFEPLKGTGGDVIIMASAFDATDNNTMTMFSHVDLYLRTTQLPGCQFPQLDRDINGSTLEALINTNMEVDPIIGTLSRRTIIENIGQARLWFVTQASNKQTARGFIFNISGQVQIVQPTMSVYALAMFPRWASHNPTSWRGGLQLQAPAGLPYRKQLAYDEDQYAEGGRKPAPTT